MAIGDRRCGSGAGPGLAAAHDAEYAALNAQRVCAFQLDVTVVGLPVLGIVDVPAPAIALVLPHAEQHRHAERRPRLQSRVRILAVGAGRLLPCDDAPVLAAAVDDADQRVALFRAPGAGRTGLSGRGCGSAA